MFSQSLRLSDVLEGAERGILFNDGLRVLQSDEVGLQLPDLSLLLCNLLVLVGFILQVTDVLRLFSASATQLGLAGSRGSCTPPVLYGQHTLVLLSGCILGDGQVSELPLELVDFGLELTLL